MKKLIVILCGVIWASEAVAVTQIIPAGEDVTGGDVHTVVTQQVYGTTRNFTVSGNQQIMSGGKSYNSVIYPYGQQNVEVGGVSYNTNVAYDALQNVNGTAYSSTVDTRGTIDVNNGGYAQDTVVNGGIFIVSRGAAVKGTLLRGGRENVSGTDEDATIIGGLQEILSGGVSERAQITSGRQQVDDGGTSIGAVVSGRGSQEVSGTTRQAVVKSGGIIDIIDNGVAEQILLDGGEMNVDSGAVSRNTTISSGTQSVYGTDTDSTINGGVQQIESGGVASGALVRTGGVQSVFSGGKAENTVVERNGWLFLFAGGSLSGKTSVTEGVVTFVGSNSIPDMEMRNAVAIVPYSHDFSSLQFDNLSGQGTFGISSSLSEGLSDKILVHSGSGNFGLVIHDYSPEGSTPARYKIIDEDSGAADSFYLVGDAVDVGAFRYGLERDGDDWVLVRTQDVTDSAVIAKNTYSSLASLFYTHLTPVYNHIRSRRNASGHDNGLWVKGLGQRVKFAYKDKSRSRIDIYGTEIGYDREVWRQNGHYLSMGVYGGYTSSRQKFDRSGHGDADTQSLGLYSLFNTDDNWFVDMVGTYFWHRQKLRSYTPAGSGVDGKYRTNSWQLSASLGKRVNFDGRWFVEPSVGLNYMHIDAVRYRTNFNTLIEASDAGYLSTRADLIAGKSFVWGDNRFLDAYGRFALIHDIDGKSKVRVADYGFAEDLSSLRYELGAGVSTAWSEDGTAYLEASAQLGSRIKLPWEINFGIQYRF